MVSRISDIPGACAACTLRLAVAKIRTLAQLRKARAQVVLDRVTVNCMKALEEAGR